MCHRLTLRGLRVRRRPLIFWELSPEFYRRPQGLDYFALLTAAISARLAMTVAR